MLGVLDIKSDHVLVKSKESVINNYIKKQTG